MVGVDLLAGEPGDGLDDFLARRFQDALQAAQHGERQDDLAVVGLLVVAAQEIGDGPGVVRQLRVLTAVQEVPASFRRAPSGRGTAGDGRDPVWSCGVGRVGRFRRNGCPGCRGCPLCPEHSWCPVAGVRRR